MEKTRCSTGAPESEYSPFRDGEYLDVISHRLAKWDAFPAATLEIRLENLEAIERGFWHEFPRPARKTRPG